MELSPSLIDGISKYHKNNDGSWKKVSSLKPMIKVALKRLNGSQNMSEKYLNEIKIHWKIFNNYGLGNFRNILSNDFNNITWKSKIEYLCLMLIDLKTLHGLGYCHKDFHSGDILQADIICISDFELSGPANEQKSNVKVYGVMPYIAPEILYGEPYTLSPDIYSVGVVMTELVSSGKPPFYNKKHDLSLALAIHNKEEYGYKVNEIKAAFEEADKEIQTSQLLCDSHSEVSNSIQLKDVDKVANLVN
ncbi:kinase-like domain-containing protein [Rhizophagus diaphanus]|nr:kinase-like domain-containing protein [Rhizophagus diaphanus] [Rhizophagus sp. MUCL 43196]